MPGVEEIRAGIILANEQAAASIAALQQAALSLEEARLTLATATTGSTQEEVTQAHGLLDEALESISGTQIAIQACMTSADAYSARL